MKLQNHKKIWITSGDVDGVGLEVALKALKSIGPKRRTLFFLFAEKKAFQRIKKQVQNFPFEIFEFNSTGEALLAPPNFKNLHVIFDDRAPIEWVRESAQLCLRDPHQNALVTGPLSKSGILRAGYREIGHTEMLKTLCKSKFLFQAYMGSQMNVMLLTDHISLEKVPSFCRDKKRWSAALSEAQSLMSRLKLKGQLAILSLDPHSGEGGIIGTQDQNFKKWMNASQFKSLNWVGPLPSDSAFEASRRKRVALYLAQYHDQGLIPFKTLHGFGEGVHLTLGLPFVRTSVDHGTAVEIFGKNKANPGSMKDAILTAIRLL